MNTEMNVHWRSLWTTCSADSAYPSEFIEETANEYAALIVAKSFDETDSELIERATLLATTFEISFWLARCGRHDNYIQRVCAVAALRDPIERSTMAVLVRDAVTAGISFAYQADNLIREEW